MKVAGFSFVRNAIRYDYPVKEAIQSILPLCEKVFVAVGNSEDETLSHVQSIDPEKVVIIPTVWDDSLREGGRVLAEETNKAFQAIPDEYDWCFYIQADEVLHEQYIPVIQNAMQDHLNHSQVQGLLFNYLHFYGSYDYIATSRKWYRREIRIIRNNKNIISWKDAQGFRWNNQQKLTVKLIDAFIFHYGWVKNPFTQLLKQKNFNKYWHSDEWLQQNIRDHFDYSGIDKLGRFTGTHPKVMQERIHAMNWSFHHDLSKDNRDFKTKLLDWWEQITGKRLFEYKNYILI